LTIKHRMSLPHELSARAGTVAAVVALAAGFVFLDGQFGPITFPLRRVVAAALLATITLASGRPRGIRLPAGLAICAMMVLESVP